MKHPEGVLNRRLVEMVKLLNVYLNHFPRHERYALSNRIRNTAYEIYDLATEAQKRYHKKTTLTSLDIAHERLRMQLLLAHELGYFRFKDGKGDGSEQEAGRRYRAITERVDEVGRLIGGWIRELRERAG